MRGNLLKIFQKNFNQWLDAALPSVFLLRYLSYDHCYHSIGLSQVQIVLQIKNGTERQ